MVINTNLPAQTSARLLTESTNLLSKSLARLSSGSKLISPEDDPAGLAVSMRLDSQIGRVGAAQTNLANAISFSQTQDGYLNKIAKALNRMGELSVLSQDATKDTTKDLALYNSEFQALNTFLGDVYGKAFNGNALFGASTALQITTGSETTDSFTLSAVGAATYAVGGDLTTVANAVTAQGAVATMIDTVAADRGTAGANISAMTSYAAQLAVLKENLSAANSRLKDVDVAEESATYAKYNILVQAGTAMLAQANVMPQAALKLLQ